MSSDEEEPTSPVLPKDSDRGSSVSSELQDEYEELLRYAVVTPKFETLASTQWKGPGSQRKDEPKVQHLPDPETEDGRLSSRSVRSSQASPVNVEPSTHSKAPLAEKTAGQSSSGASLLSDAPSENPQTASKRSRSNSPAFSESSVTEMFISEENISKMENILDTWSLNLKSNVLTELQKWKYAFLERHRLEMTKERERHAAQASGLKSELHSLKELLHTYETSNHRKDQVIKNLSQVLDRQKEKLEKMRTFTHWRLQHAEAKEEAHAAHVARQHHHLQLKKKVWLAWRSLVQKHWKVKVERACRSRAEEVCSRLSTEYEAKLAEHCEALEKAQAEIRRLHVERERYEESMKKAFMRGVCALNMEALSMFHSTEGRPEQLQVPQPHDFLPPQEERGSATLAHLQPLPSSFKRFSPLHFDRSDPSQREADDRVGPRGPTSQEEMLPSTTVVHSSLPLGGIASSHKQSGGRFVTAGQQKPSKTVTARITARADVGKVPHGGGLQVMGVAPPMSSVVVERHHPVTQLTVGQAMAAKFPRPSQQSHASTAGRGASRGHSSSCNVHSIKVVD
ncbi:centrosomal protein POC5 isoform X2 [Fundulus heteroclitus]|uniref:centrosomal protein POC5 isoform X2 n=1 Tax=Fundulus heteroclitus TaxID=8078 RepID=UPI00165BA8A7|nr:centrosomal protein POC5 isoform X2 [Fundulus heteroclitus]